MRKEIEDDRMMRRALLFVSLFTVISFLVAVAGASSVLLQNLEDMSLPQKVSDLEGLSIVSSGKRVYVGGGKTANSGQLKTDVFSLDLENPSAGWSQLAQNIPGDCVPSISPLFLVPQPPGSGGGGAYGEDILMCCTMGTTDASRLGGAHYCYYYNMVLNQWSATQSARPGRYGAAISVTNTHILVVGGYDASNGTAIHTYETLKFTGGVSVNGVPFLASQSWKEHSFGSGISVGGASGVRPFSAFAAHASTGKSFFYLEYFANGGLNEARYGVAEVDEDQGLIDFSELLSHGDSLSPLLDTTNDATSNVVAVDGRFTRFGLRAADSALTVFVTDASSPIYGSVTVAADTDGTNNNVAVVLGNNFFLSPAASHPSTNRQLKRQKASSFSTLTRSSEEEQTSKVRVGKRFYQLAEFYTSNDAQRTKLDCRHQSVRLRLSNSPLCREFLTGITSDIAPLESSGTHQECTFPVEIPASASGREVWFCLTVGACPKNSTAPDAALVPSLQNKARECLVDNMCPFSDGKCARRLDSTGQSGSSFVIHDQYWFWVEKRVVGGDFTVTPAVPPPSEHSNTTTLPLSPRPSNKTQTATIAAPPNHNRTATIEIPSNRTATATVVAIPPGNRSQTVPVVNRTATRATPQRSHSVSAPQQRSRTVSEEEEGAASHTATLPAKHTATATVRLSPPPHSSTKTTPAPHSSTKTTPAPHSTTPSSPERNSASLTVRIEPTETKTVEEKKTTRTQTQSFSTTKKRTNTSALSPSMTVQEEKKKNETKTEGIASATLTMVEHKHTATKTVVVVPTSTTDNQSSAAPVTTDVTGATGEPSTNNATAVTTDSPSSSSPVPTATSTPSPSPTAPHNGRNGSAAGGGDDSSITAQMRHPAVQAVTGMAGVFGLCVVGFVVAVVAKSKLCSARRRVHDVAPTVVTDDSFLEPLMESPSVSKVN